jgi:hypothetical protein
VETQRLQDVNGAGVRRAESPTLKILACHDTGRAPSTDARPTFVASQAGGVGLVKLNLNLFTQIHAAIITLAL